MRLVDQDRPDGENSHPYERGERPPRQSLHGPLALDVRFPFGYLPFAVDVHLAARLSGSKCGEMVSGKRKKGGMGTDGMKEDEEDGLEDEEEVFFQGDVVDLSEDGIRRVAPARLSDDELQKVSGSRAGATSGSRDRERTGRTLSHGVVYRVAYYCQLS